jgi:hypothetical protein
LFHGRIDAITSSGYVEGWAFDPAKPLRPLTVSVLAGQREVAQGVANLYRWDLVDGQCGTGWCAFRLKLSGSVSRLRRQGLALWDLARQTEIQEADAAVALADDQEPALVTLEDIIADDPTVVQAIEQLRGCASVFSDFIATEGVDEFIRAVYVYVLGRPVDAAGLALYRPTLQDGSLSPYGLLKILYDGEEFQSAPRQLIAPPEPGFVFHRS